MLSAVGLNFEVIMLSYVLIFLFISGFRAIHFTEAAQWVLLFGYLVLDVLRVMRFYLQRNISGWLVLESVIESKVIYTRD